MPSRTLNPLSGEFLDPAREAAYREALLPETVGQLRIALLILAAIYLLLAFVDYHALGSSPAFTLLLTLRASFALACLGLAFVCGWRPRLALRSLPLNLVLGLLVVSALLLLPLRPQTLDSQLAAVMALTFTLYLLVPQRVPWMLAWALLLGLGYLALLSQLRLVPPSRLPLLALALAVVNGVGLLSALRLARLHRRQFAALQAERDANRRMQEENETRRRLEGELRYLAQTDSLTGVHNRRWFLELARQELLHAQRRHSPLSICLIDLDHFKLVNDSLGHAVGDEVLAQVSRLCRKELRACDVLGRLGGEEFGIAMPDTPPEAAFWVAERLRSRIESTRFGQNAGLKLSATLGISAVRVGENDLEGALLRADQALYRGKREGRNRVVLAPCPSGGTGAAP